MPNDSCNQDGIGAKPEKGGAKAMRVNRDDESLKNSDVNVNVNGSGGNRSSSSSSSSSSSGSSSSNSNSSRDVDVYQSRNRMMAAGKRRRWTDVRGFSTQEVY